jgi:hypothetical protein
LSGPELQDHEGSPILRDFLFFGCNQVPNCLPQKVGAERVVMAELEVPRDGVEKAVSIPRNQLKMGCPVPYVLFH